MTRTLDILLAEDNPADVRLFEESLTEVGFPINLHHVGDGELALKFLRKEGDFSDSPRPDLVIVDILLPKMNGREVVAEIKQNPDLKAIPVVVLASQLDESNVEDIYELLANACLAKPKDLDGSITLARNLKGFWYDLAILSKK